MISHNSRLLLDAICAQCGVQLAKKKLFACLAREHAALEQFHQFQMERTQHHLVNMEAKIGSLRHTMRECGVPFLSRSPLTLRQHKQRGSLSV